MNDHRHIVGVEQLAGCPDDNEARKIAMTLLNDRPHYSGVAVWERSRKVFEELIARSA